MLSPGYPADLGQVSDNVRGGNPRRARQQSNLSQRRRPPRSIPGGAASSPSQEMLPLREMRRAGGPKALQKAGVRGKKWWRDTFSNLVNFVSPGTGSEGGSGLGKKESSSVPYSFWPFLGPIHSVGSPGATIGQANWPPIVRKAQSPVW